jgi:acyl-CoA synthetase (AMP-forming)/AMP-acid ligase II
VPLSPWPGLNDYASLGELLRARAGAWPNRDLLRVEGEALTFGGVEAISNRLAGALRAAGVAAGARVALCLPNGFEFPLAWLAVAKLGAVIVPINPQSTTRELAYFLEHSKATHAISGGQQLGALSEELAGPGSLVWLGRYGPSAEGLSQGVDVESEIEGFPEEFPIQPAPGEGLLNLQYTSGTTGLPKACMLSHRYWLKIGHDLAGFGEIGERDINLTAQPFYYMDPQWNLVLCMVAGIPLVVLPRFSASTFWRSVCQEGVTFLYLIGAMPTLLLEQPEANEFERGHALRFILGSGLPSDRKSECEARWGIPWFESYGSTETGDDTIVLYQSGASAKEGSVGRPIPGKQLKIVDEDGQEVKVGDVGELLIRGEPRMLGYWNDEEATRQKVRGDWVHSGDLFRCSEDGDYSMVGRLKDGVRRGGENISAADVESVFASSPWVQLAALIPVPDPLFGEEGKILVCAGSYGGERPDVEVLLDFARARLAPYKVPRYLEWIENFPMTASGRIVKRRLSDTIESKDLSVYDSKAEAWK